MLSWRRKRYGFIGHRCLRRPVDPRDLHYKTRSGFFCRAALFSSCIRVPLAQGLVHHVLGALRKARKRWP